MPYLPFLSNCANYGKHIPLFSLFEQHPACELVSPEETYPLTEFDFNGHAIGDVCDEIELDCIYDDINDLGPYKKWWSVEQNSNIFYFSKDPMTSEDLSSNSSKSITDVLF